jgi:hypothetical protein
MMAGDDGADSTNQDGSYSYALVRNNGALDLTDSGFKIFPR